MSYEVNEATGENQYFPFVTVTDGAFSGIKETFGGMERVSFIVSAGTIEVRNAETMNVYDLNGRLVACGKAASVAPGIYVVKAGEVTAKISVR